MKATLAQKLFLKSIAFLSPRGARDESGLLISLNTAVYGFCPREGHEMKGLNSSHILRTTSFCPREGHEMKGVGR